MALENARSWIGGLLLALGGVMLTLIVLSGRWKLSVHTPGDRVRISLGDDYQGGGVLTIASLHDPTASFMLSSQSIKRRGEPWRFRWRLDPMWVNPPMLDPNGWGAHELPGVAWFVDSKSILNVACITWPVPLILAIPGALVWRLGRRAAGRADRGLCVGCGYDLVAIPATSPCPECGGGRGVTRRREGERSETERSRK
ncbi:MAG: hypothetical protein AABZ53_14865 [Planctomycetota bacterium]